MSQRSKFPPVIVNAAREVSARSWLDPLAAPIREESIGEGDTFSPWVFL